MRRRVVTENKVATGCADLLRRLAEELATFSDSLRIEPLDAAVASRPAALALSPSVSGERLDAEKLVPQIEAALSDPG